MSRVEDWINLVAQSDRGLAALLRGLLTIEKGEGALTFVWRSEFHKTASGEREGEIRKYLGALRGAQISHISIDEWAKDDPMILEALDLGAKIKIVEMEES
jgi:hypothetical protein